MVETLLKWRTNRHRRDTKEIVTTQKETLAKSWIERLEAVEAALAKFKDSAEFVQPHAFKELFDRVKALEERPIDITPQSDVSSEDVQILAEAVKESGDAALRFTKAAAVLVKRMDAADARSAQVEELAVALEGGLGQLKEQVESMPDAILQEFRAARAAQKQG